MLKFNEQKQIESVNGALALRNQINELIDGICKEGYKNICWLGIGGTYASCLQAEVHMKEKSKLQTATFRGQQGRISRPVKAILSGRL